MEANPVPPVAVEAAPEVSHREGNSKRIDKFVQAVALFFATASVLMVNQPARVERSRLLFDIYTTFVNLTFCVGIVLSIYSIVARKGSPTSASSQKWLMVVGLGFMAAVFVLRTCIVLPINSLIFVWVLSLLIGLIIFFSLRLAWNKNRGPPAVQNSGDVV